MANVDLRLRWWNEVKQTPLNLDLDTQSKLLQKLVDDWKKLNTTQQQTHQNLQTHTKTSAGAFDFLGKQIMEVGGRIAGVFTLIEIEEFTREAVLAYGKTERVVHQAQEIAQLNAQQMSKVTDTLRQVQRQTGEKFDDLVKDYGNFVARTHLEGLKAADIFQTVNQAAELLQVSSVDMAASISASINNLTLDVSQAKDQMKQWEDILPGIADGFAKYYPKMTRELEAAGFTTEKSGNEIAAALQVINSHYSSPTEAAAALNELINKALTNPNLYAERARIREQKGGFLELMNMQLDWAKSHKDDPEFFSRIGYSAEAQVGMKALRDNLPKIAEIVKNAVTDIQTSDEKATALNSDFKGSTDKATAALDEFADAIGKFVAPAAKAVTDLWVTQQLDITSSQMEGKRPWFDPSPQDIGRGLFKDFHILSRGSLLHADPSARTPLSPTYTPPSAEQHSTGGIVTQPTLTTLGENGPEAIIPLTELRQAAAAQARSEEQQKSVKELSTMERIHQLALRTPQLAGYLDPWKEMQHKPGATNWSGNGRQQMAAGGVSIGPTDATIGEAGPEMRVNLNDPSKSTLVTRRTDVTLGKDGPEAIVPLSAPGTSEIPPNARAFISAIGSTETGFSYKEAYTDKYNQPGNNANVRKYGSVAADYGYYQMNRMDADEAVNKYGMDPMQARHLYGGVDQKSTVEDQTAAVNQYLQRRWPAQYQKMVDTGDFEGMRKTAQGTWFGLKDHQALARQEFQNPSLSKTAAATPAPSPAQVAAKGSGRRVAHMAEGGLVLPQPSNANLPPLTSAGADVDKTIGGFQGQEWYIAGRDYAVSLVESLDGLRNHSPADKEKLKKFMAAGGEHDADNGLNPMDEAWCAHTVRSAYRQAGLGGTLGGTSPTASSFKDWQQSVKAENVQRGDVLLLPPTSERSGHVGTAAGPLDPNTSIPRAKGAIPLAAGNQALPGQKYERRDVGGPGEGGAASTVPLPVGGPELGPDRLLTARRAVPPIHLRTPGPATSSSLAETQAQEAAGPIQVPIEPVVSTQAVMSARRQTARIANNFQGHADAQHARTAHGSAGHV